MWHLELPEMKADVVLVALWAFPDNLAQKVETLNFRAVSTEGLGQVRMFRCRNPMIQSSGESNGVCLEGAVLAIVESSSNPTSQQQAKC